MKTAFLNFRACTSNHPTKENYDRVGVNSGNIVFSYSLANTIRCDSVTLSNLRAKMDEGVGYDNLVVRDFITLKDKSTLEYFEPVLRLFHDKPIVPISLGVMNPDMNPDFRFHPNAERVLKEIAERAVIGCRGEYTAYILEKHGIRNTRVIGCPSMYLGANHKRKIVKKEFSEVKKVLSNWRTLSNLLADLPHEREILRYMRDHTHSFIDQTQCFCSRALLENEMKDLVDFTVRERKIFFIFEDWYRYAKDFDFCIGARFHGNVVPLLGGVPALFLYFDSRTKEMVDYFEFPSMHISKFDTSKPLEYYYDLADYSRFNRNYANKLDNFISFCLENNLELNNGMDQYFYRMQQGLSGRPVTHRGMMEMHMAMGGVKMKRLARAGAARLLPGEDGEKSLRRIRGFVKLCFKHPVTAVKKAAKHIRRK